MEHLQEFHRRNLPHYYPKYRKFFITFRLYNSIPRKKILEWRGIYEREIQKITDLPDTIEYGNKADIASRRFFFYKMII